MDDFEQRLQYLETANENLRVQNRVLAAALKGFLQALPTTMAQDAAESIQAAFEDEAAELAYENEADADLFQDAVYEFFRNKR